MSFLLPRTIPLKNVVNQRIIACGSIVLQRNASKSGYIVPRGPIQRKRYEVGPSRIGLIKSWDSKHTGGLEGSLWAHDRFIDDVMIRKFIEGTFYELLVSDIVVKRRLNQVVIAIFVYAANSDEVQKVYFLKGYSETLLSELLGCLVTLELRSGFEIKGPMQRRS